ncbi:ATP-binding protein [Rubrivivax gelatinosus]|uniref:ATP-binding protein n=1 Tax=Rubrivivax gelatinosus TaxID=28068 RepID=UPI000306C696|nr:ATP-binding protein [Rubrivivax gelatinosus]MBG6081119.1 ATP-dependent DNA helicase RecG [Rubrivivax gelatinosus]
MNRSAEDLLQELQSVDESHRIEAKRGSQVDRSIMETVVAFSNEPGLGGGHLLLGVERDPADLFGGAYRVLGVADPDRLQSDLASQCASMLNRPVRPRISVETLQGKTVVVVAVPEAAPAEKPIFLSKLGLPRGAFRRIGPTDQEGSEDDLVGLYAGQQVETFDGAVLPDTELSDIDPAALQEYRRLRERANPSAEELTWGDDELLRSLGGAVRRDGGLRPTVAGLLLFGTPQALRRCFPMMRIDYIRVPGRQWVEDPEHRFDTLEIRAPLLAAVRRAENAVRDELMQSFSLPEGALAREDEPALPLRVIREAIVNAVMHRSYRIHGAIQIIRYANRLEIRNPGHSIKAEEQLGEPGSETRNPRIATVLHEVNVAETKGSGIRAMRELMQANGLLPPTFESTRRPDQFVATLLFHHFLGQDDLAWLRALTAEALSDEERRALVVVRELGAIDNAAYRNINRTDTLNASVHLRRLRDLGLLAMKGSGSRTYYVPGPGFPPRPPSSADASQAHAQTTQAGPQTPQAPPHTPQAEGQTHQADAPLPAALAQRLPEPGTRPRRELLQQLVFEICSWRPHSARELAGLLGRRDHKHLVKEVLRPMVASGLLAFTIPSMEKHPDQRYTARSKTTARADDDA